MPGDTEGSGLNRPNRDRTARRGEGGIARMRGVPRDPVTGSGDNREKGCRSVGPRFCEAVGASPGAFTRSIVSGGESCAELTPVFESVPYKDGEALGQEDEACAAHLTSALLPVITRLRVARSIRTALLLMSLPVLSACGNMPLSWEWQVAWKIEPDPELVQAVEENRIEDAVRMVKRGGTLYYRKRGFGGIDRCYGGILGLAAKRNHSEMVRRMIEAGVEPNPPIARESPCISALSDAARAGHVEIVKQLLNAGAHPNWEEAAWTARTVEKTKKLLARWDAYPIASRSGRPVSLSAPLVGAIENNHIEVVRILLNAGAHTTDSLLRAAETGNIEIARLLLDAGADPNLLPGWYTPSTENLAYPEIAEWYPLSIAAVAGPPEMVQLLLEAGARINGPKSAVHTPLMGAALVGNIETVKMLLEAGVDTHAGDPLRAAAKHDHTEVARILVTAGVELESTASPLGWTPLFYAARSNNVDLLKLLIKAGASVHAVNKYDSTPLMRAAMEGSAESVNVLIGAGADIDAENALGGTALLLAVKHGHPGVAGQLLDAGADPNRMSARIGVTPLQYAAGRVSPSHVKLFIEAGADVNLPDPDGLTALMFAAAGITPGKPSFKNFRWEESADFRRLQNWDSKILWKKETDPALILARIKVVRQLIVAGASLNATDQIHGSTALHRAARENRPEIVRLLLEAGADPGLTTKDGMTPLRVAQKAGHPDIVEIISATTKSL